MRRAKSYSIVDHALLHGSYFHTLSHQALSLYLFFVVVGDRDGKSYYSGESLGRILRMTDHELCLALQSLVEVGLIHYQRPYCTVLELTAAQQILSRPSLEQRSLEAPVYRDLSPQNILEHPTLPPSTSDQEYRMGAIRDIIQKLKSCQPAGPQTRHSSAPIQKSSAVNS